MDSFSQDERRVWRRFDVPVTGKLFAQGSAGWNCEVLDLSPGGARVQAPEFPPPGPVVLYVNRIGRIEAEALVIETGVMRLRFVCNEPQRHYISQVLGQMLEGGVAQMTHLRRQSRIALSNFHFVRACGTTVPCDALDISLRGMSLRTAERPPVGEFVTIGHSRGRIVRHHDQGVSVEFLHSGAGTVVRFPSAYGRTGLADPKKPA